MTQLKTVYEVLTALKGRPEHLTDVEVEAKFNSLCLAFKTDGFTLTNRLELHQRQRDLAEKNVEDEIFALKEILNVLSQICAEEETRELVKRSHHHLEVLHQSTARLSSRTEVYGAVQQEERINRANEVMLLFVENLKRCHDKTIQELEEYKRILADNNLLSEETVEPDDGRRSMRTYSMSSMGIGKPNSRRRASIAALPRSNAERMDGKTKFATFVANAASRNSVCNIDNRRCSLMYNLRPFSTLDRTSISEKTRKRSVDDLHLVSNNLEQNNNEHIFRDGNEQLRKPLSPKLDNSSIKLQSLPEAPNNLHHSQTTSIPDAESNMPSLKTINPLEDIAKGGSSYPEDKSELSNMSPTIHSLEPFNWSQTQLVQRAYASEPSEQDDEEEEDLESLRKLSTISYSSTRSAAVSLLSLNHWMENSTQVINCLRYALGGFLFLAALFSLLFTFMPTSMSATTSCQPRNWYSVEEFVRSHFTLQHQGKPPT